MSYSKCPTSPVSTGGRFFVALVVAIACVSTSVSLAAQSGAMRAADPGLESGPSFRDMLSLRSVGGPAISPDGQSVAYTLRIPDWEQNRSVSELWIVEGDGTPMRIEIAPMNGGDLFASELESAWYAASPEMPLPGLPH